MPTTPRCGREEFRGGALHRPARPEQHRLYCRPASDEIEVLRYSIDLIIMAGVWKGRPLVYERNGPGLICPGQDASRRKHVELRFKTLHLAPASGRPELSTIAELLLHAREPGTGTRILDKGLGRTMVPNHFNHGVSHRHVVEPAAENMSDEPEIPTIFRGARSASTISSFIAILRVVAGRRSTVALGARPCVGAGRSITPARRVPRRHPPRAIPG
jgi:hypothetical protein